MRLYNVRGRLQSKNVNKYLIDWDAKCKSKIQKKVKDFFKTYWENHVVYEEFPVFGTRLKVDLLNATKRIAVEVQGQQHTSYSKFFHGSRTGYWKSIKRQILMSGKIKKIKRLQNLNKISIFPPQIL